MCVASVEGERSSWSGDTFAELGAEEPGVDGADIIEGSTRTLSDTTLDNLPGDRTLLHARPPSHICASRLSRSVLMLLVPLLLDVVWSFPLCTVLPL